MFFEIEIVSIEDINKNKCYLCHMQRSNHCVEQKNEEET